jgi:hypothetical protein
MATISRRAVTADNTTRFVAFRPKSMLVRRWLAASAQGMPMATPSPARINASRSTIRKMPRRAGAESHANADFLRAAGDVIGEHAIETDRGEGQGQQSEDSSKTRHETVMVEIAGGLFTESHHVYNRHIRVDAGELASVSRISG